MDRRGALELIAGLAGGVSVVALGAERAAADRASAQGAPSAAVPDIPAAAESGVLPGYDVTTWYGLFAPRGTPAPVIAKLNKTLNESLADPTVRERLATAGVVVKTSTPEAFGDFLASEYKRWDAVREAAGIPQQ